MTLTLKSRSQKPAHDIRSSKMNMYAEFEVKSFSSFVGDRAVTDSHTDRHTFYAISTIDVCARPRCPSSMCVFVS